TPAPEPAPAPRPAQRSVLAGAGPAVPHVGERPPTYAPEPTAVPEADPGMLGAVVPDTVLEGAQYGAATLRAVSVRGDSARYRGEPRRDTLLVTRFGEAPDGLLLAALGGFDRSAADGEVAPEAVATATAEAVRQLASAIGRSRTGLAADLRDGARDRLRYGLQRLATSAAAPLRALAPEPEGDDGAQSPAALHCMLLSLDPEASYRAAFGVGPGGLYLLRSGHWIDAYAARLLHHPDGQPPVPDTPVPDPRPFRFRMVPATVGDILLLCTPGLARPIADEPAVAHFLSSHWAHPHPPGTVDFLRQVQVRARGYADDRTAAAIWTG
ncbi:protein phosphatase 2C domain-containing protein, partial [Kitasatospora sp. RG8]